MRASEKNKIFYICAYALRSLSLLTATGTLIQTLLTVLGMSAERIYFHTSAVGAVNVAVILLFATFADTPSLIKRSAAVQLAGGILFLLFLPLCIAKKAGITEFIILITAGVLQSVVTALHTVCDYKLPYYIIKKEEYGFIMAFCGILSSVISFGAGAVMTALSSKHDYKTLMLFAFIFAFICSCLAAVLTLKLKNISQYDTVIKTQSAGKSFISVISSPVFYKLLPANLIRGFSSGITLVFAVIAADELNYSEQITTATVSVQAIASLAGCALFGVLSKKISPRISVFAGSLTFLLLPLILIPERPLLFLCLTGVILFGRTLIDYAVPSLLLYAVPVEIAGPYNAFRMILHNGGSLIATTVAAFVPVSILLPLAALFQLISGLVFLALPLLKKASPLKVSTIS